VTHLISLGHKFVEFIPTELEDGKIYISIRFATASHKCCCGCGSVVVTPISPTDWKLIFDGKSISLYPSIGNWGFKCQSHYWIQNNQVVWAPQMSQEDIEEGRAHDRMAKEVYFRSIANGDDTEGGGEKRPVKRGQVPKVKGRAKGS